MAGKKSVGPTKAALAKSEKKSLSLKSMLVVGPQNIETGLKVLAAALSGPLEPPQLADVFKRLKVWADDIEALTETARKMTIELLKKDGLQDSESTRRTLRAGGLVLAMRAHRTGYDPKKVEQLIRSKNAQPNAYMDAKVTFAVNEQKLGLAKADLGITDDELEATKYNESWAVETPTPVGEDE